LPPPPDARPSSGARDRDLCDHGAGSGRDSMSPTAIARPDATCDAASRLRPGNCSSAITTTPSLHATRAPAASMASTVPGAASTIAADIAIAPGSRSTCAPDTAAGARSTAAPDIALGTVPVIAPDVAPAARSTAAPDIALGTVPVIAPDVAPAAASACARNSLTG